MIEASSNEDRLLAVGLLTGCYIIIRREALLDLAVDVDHVFKLVENVFVGLFQPTLAPAEVGRVRVVLSLVHLVRHRARVVQGL